MPPKKRVDAKSKASKAQAQAAREAEEATAKAKWLEYALKHAEVVIENMHVRWEDSVVGGSGAAAGVTLPQIRLRPSEKVDLLPPAAVLSPTQDALVRREVITRTLITVTGVAVYCDPTGGAYLEDIGSGFPPNTANPVATTADGSGKAAEGARLIAVLKARWGTITHQAMLYPLNVSGLATLGLGGVGPSDVRLASLDVKASAVKLCADALQLAALARGWAAFRRSLRREHCLRFLVSPAAVGALAACPPLVPAPRPGFSSVLTTPALARPLEDPTSVSGAAFLRRTFGPRDWARPAWHWAYRCVVDDLRPWMRRGWGNTLYRLKQQRRLIELYKERSTSVFNIEGATLRATSGAAMSSQVMATENPLMADTGSALDMVSEGVNYGSAAVTAAGSASVAATTSAATAAATAMGAALGGAAAAAASATSTISTSSTGSTTSASSTASASPSLLPSLRLSEMPTHWSPRQEWELALLELNCPLGFTLFGMVKFFKIFHAIPMI